MDVPDELYKDDNVLGVHDHHPVRTVAEENRQYFTKWAFNKVITTDKSERKK